MTPQDWDLFVRGYNEAHGDLPPPTSDQLAELKKRYPDQ